MKALRTLVEIPFLIFDKMKPTDISEHRIRTVANGIIKEIKKDVHIESRAVRDGAKIQLEITPIIFCTKEDIDILKVCFDKLSGEDCHDRRYYREVALKILDV